MHSSVIFIVFNIPMRSSQERRLANAIIFIHHLFQNVQFDNISRSFHMIEEEINSLVALLGLVNLTMRKVIFCYFFRFFRSQWGHEKRKEKKQVYYYYMSVMVSFRAGMRCAISITQPSSKCCLIMLLIPLFFTMSAFIWWTTLVLFQCSCHLDVIRGYTQRAFFSIPRAFTSNHIFHQPFHNPALSLQCTLSMFSHQELGTVLFGECFLTQQRGTA